MSPPPLQPSPAPGVAVVGIDWGTTHRRCYRIGSAGTLQAEHVDDLGLLAAGGPGWFRAALDSALAAWPDLPGDAPVLMSGMVGSAQGWHAVPYLGLETPLAALGEHLFDLPDGPPGRHCAIVPGYAMRGAEGTLDVMRGEETQLLGALALGLGDGWVVLPGTHSKWVRLRGGRIERFATFMTGELFGLLAQHGTLAPLMAQGRDAPAAFERGLRAAADGSLSNLLFGVRAGVVAGAMAAADARDQVSGLLLGAEWHAALRREGGRLERVSVIGVPALAERHRQAGALLGVAVDLIDPRQAHVAALAGLRAFL